MKVGEKTSEWVHFGEVRPRRMGGVIEYIHPEKRFYVVRFTTDVGSFAEAYFLPGHGRTEHDERDGNF